MSKKTESKTSSGLGDAVGKVAEQAARTAARAAHEARAAAGEAAEGAKAAVREVAEGARTAVGQAARGAVEAAAGAARAAGAVTSGAPAGGDNASGGQADGRSADGAERKRSAASERTPSPKKVPRPAKRAAGEAASGGGKKKADPPAAVAARRGGKKTPPPPPSGPSVEPRLKVRYRDEVVGALMGEFSYPSVMQVPRLLKITLNAGLGRAVGNAAIIKVAQGEMAQITGQRPVVCRAKKSIANFKLREGQPIGCMVTLRRERMWEFFDRLVLVAIPRIRDFHGLNPRSFDGRGNYNFSVKEQLLFPEIVYDKVTEPIGMSITFSTSARTDREGRALLTQFGMPFRA